MAQGIEEQVGVLPAIETEGHLVQVGSEMFCADLVPASDDAALEQRECGFDSICGHTETVFVAHVFFAEVIDDLVLDITDSILVGRGTVCHQHFYISTQVLADVLRQGSRLNIVSVEESEIAIALLETDDYFFGIESGLPALSKFATANECFVHLHGAVEHGFVQFFHSGADSVTQIPRGLVAHADSALDLVGADALLSFTKEQGDHEPLGKRQMRIVEDRASSDGELVFTIIAVEQLHGSGETDNFTALAPWALRAFRPAQAFK